jgi:hypothetical protein
MASVNGLLPAPLRIFSRSAEESGRTGEPNPSHGSRALCRDGRGRLSVIVLKRKPSAASQAISMPNASAAEARAGGSAVRRRAMVPHPRCLPWAGPKGFGR